MSYPLNSKLDNGASVSDWLGTAMTAAQCAAKRLEDVRSGSLQPVDDVADAIGYLEQALEEARLVQQHVAHVRAYSTA
jgi:hypothetical protein